MNNNKYEYSPSYMEVNNINKGITLNEVNNLGSLISDEVKRIIIKNSNISTSETIDSSSFSESNRIKLGIKSKVNNLDIYNSNIEGKLNIKPIDLKKDNLINIENSELRGVDYNVGEYIGEENSLYIEHVLVNISNVRILNQYSPLKILGHIYEVDENYIDLAMDSVKFENNVFVDDMYESIYAPSSVMLFKGKGKINNIEYINNKSNIISGYDATFNINNVNVNINNKIKKVLEKHDKINNIQDINKNEIYNGFAISENYSRFKGANINNINYFVSEDIKDLKAKNILHLQADYLDLNVDRLNI